ncbi:Uncharacterized protein FWK35_00023996, partial [Aphis craccivora]
MLKKTAIKLELLSDYEMLLMFEKGNNLYGWVMSQYLPFGDFKWVKTVLDGLNDLMKWPLSGEYMKWTALDTIMIVSPQNIQYHVPLTDIYIGVNATTSITNLKNNSSVDSNEGIKFFNLAKIFILSLLSKSRLKFGDVPACGSHVLTKDDICMAAMDEFEDTVLAILLWSRSMGCCWRKRATINPQNVDRYCFKWAILAKHVTGMAVCHVGENYRQQEDYYNFDGITFTTPLSDILKFEKKLGNNLMGTFEEKKIISSIIGTCSKRLKVHRVIQFNQSDWLAKYIELNNEMRKKARNDFEKDFFKLMNNDLFGKTMQSKRKEMKMELVSCERRLQKLINKCTFKHSKNYNENFNAVALENKIIRFDKPIYIGFAVLDISKTKMYDYHYNVMKKHYKDKIKLMYTDTVYHINTDDFYKDLAANNSLLDHMDTANLPHNHPCYVRERKKSPGYFSDEVDGNAITEFCALRAKSYAFNVYTGPEDRVGRENIKAKGIRQHVVKNHMTLEDHRKCLFDEDGVEAYRENVSIRSFKHQLMTMFIDSAPGHKAKTTQEWLENNVPNFIKASDWPSASPDLNPLDYGLWNILEERACKKRHANKESLKRSIVKAAAEIPLETIRTCIEQWPERLRRCIEKEGEHFEKRATINPQNVDQQCFKWAVLAKHVTGTTVYRIGENYKKKKFQPPRKYSTYEVYPLRVADEEKTDHFDLLLVTDGDNSHYVYISNFSRLIRKQKTGHDGRVVFCKRCFMSFDNQNLKFKPSGQEALNQHKLIYGAHKPILPDIIILNRKAVANPLNIDRQCFKWEILAKHVPHDNCMRVGANSLREGN